MKLFTFRVRFASWFINTLVPRLFPRVNPAARWLLKSRLHPLLSWYVIVLRFKGRRSGRPYEVPVAYHRASDGVLEALTGVGGAWWRNLIDAGTVSVLYRGSGRAAQVDVITEDEAAMTSALRSRDLWRRVLMPVSLDQTVLLRVHLRD